MTITLVPPVAVFDDEPEPYAVAPLAVSGTDGNRWTVIAPDGRIIAPVDWDLTQATQARDGLNWGWTVADDFAWVAA